MSKRYWIAGGLVLVAVIVIAIFLFLRPSEKEERPATVVETVNRVDAHPRPKDDWQPAVVDMLIYGGGQVRTGAESSARLELLEGIVRVSADSIFTVKQSTTRQGKLVSTLFLQEGRLWAHLTSDQPHEFTVETSGAVAAVRDTRFSVKVAAGETFVSVAEGEVQLTAQEQSVTVAAEQQATVKPDQPPSPPESMSDEERALWASEGEMPDLAPPPPTPTATPVSVEMWVDVSCALTGPAGDLASRHPETILDVMVLNADAVQVAVQTPDGVALVLPRYGDIFGEEQRFTMSVAGLPQAGGIYTFTAFDAAGTPIPGAVASDVYLGDHEPDPPSNVRAEVTEAGILVTWDPSPIIPGAFDPGGSPSAGFYQIIVNGEEQGMVYGWNHSQPLSETSHLIPLRRQDFGPADRGMALEELEDDVFQISVTAFSTPPEGTAGWANECSAHDPAEDLQIIIEDGQVRAPETPSPTPPPAPTSTSRVQPTAPPPTATSAPVPPTPTPTLLSEVQLGLDDNGRQIELVTGQTLVITLGSNPSTGYEWLVADIDTTILQQLGEAEFQPDPNAAPGMVGVGGTQTLRFAVASPGQMTLRLVYARPWESVQPSETFSIQVVAR